MFPGLEGVIIKETNICYIDIEYSKIYYRGYDLEELAEKSTYEETAYLLLYGRLPRRSELDEFTRGLAERRRPARRVDEVLAAVAPSAEPIDAMRTAVSAMAAGEELADKSPEAELKRGLKILAAEPYIVANADRIRRRLPTADAEYENYADYFLRLLRGSAPHPKEARALDVMLIIYAEHGMNNSAFTAVTVSSTLADAYAAVTAAIASLKGPLHGGANVDAARMIEEIGKAERVEKWVDNALAQGRRIPGFGHRIYKKGPDPRLRVLRRLAKGLAELRGNYSWYEVAERLEEYMTAKLSHKGIYANTDLYASVVFHYLGLPVDLNLPVFAMARTAGWIAHAVEYRAKNRLIRPTEKYIGPLGLRYAPIEDRG